MNWTFLAFAAIALGPILIWRARRAYTEPVVDADAMPEQAMWGYFLMLVGAWGALGSWFNMSDLFFALMMVPAILAGVATLKGYKSKKNSRPLPDWAAFGFSNWLVLGIIGLGKTFIVEPMQIPSSSMRPGLIVGDFIVISKFSYGVRIPFINEPIVPIGKPQRGDVVVFRLPSDTRINYIKRLIGVSGDVVEYRNKRLTVNGQVYNSLPVGEYAYSDKTGEKALAARVSEDMGAKKYETLNVSGIPTVRLPVSDFPNREACQYDDTGFVCKVPEGRYFMMGDNRDNSQDSRYWGFVGENQIAGKAFGIWMNWAGLGSWPDFKRIGSSIQ